MCCKLDYLCSNWKGKETMGQCCQKTSKYGFQADLASPLLLNDVYDRLPVEARVLHIRLVGLKDIAAGSGYNGLSDPYVEMKVMPNDPVAGAQQQFSEVKPQTLNPTWVRVILWCKSLCESHSPSLTSSLDASVALPIHFVQTRRRTYSHFRLSLQFP